LYGPQGIGKTVFAQWLAQSLLCESAHADGQACGACASCAWFTEYSHPDYRCLRPEILESDTPQTELDETKSSKAATKTAKAPSKEIVIDQVRSLAEFMTLSTHRQGRRVIVIYPAEAMNTAAANALLKALEEPGPNTIFILVTHSLDALLATLISRCHRFGLTMPARDQALSWLAQQHINQAEQLLTEQGGAPLAVVEFEKTELTQSQEIFLRYLQRPDYQGALNVADALQKIALPLLVSWMQRWLYDVFSFKLAGKIRYYPRYQKEINMVAARSALPALLSLLDNNTQRKAVAEHPLSAKLLIEEMLLDYVALIGSKKR
jgi:DNA polymerase-3 subunit delta'